jgi:hypothetical protein
VPEQVGRDHGVGAGQTANHPAPGERVLKQAVDQQERWAGARDPVHEPMAVQPHLVACYPRNLGSSRSAPQREFGFIAVSSSG